MKKFFFIVLLFGLSFPLKANVPNNNSNASMLCSIFLYPNQSSYLANVYLDCGIGYDTIGLNITAHNNYVYFNAGSASASETAVYQSVTDSYYISIPFEDVNYNFEYTTKAGNIIDWLQYSRTQ